MKALQAENELLERFKTEWQRLQAFTSGWRWSRKAV